MVNINFDIKEELKRLPQRPGVYLFRDRRDTVIYVGKAINLKNRVKSYFLPSSTGKNAQEARKVKSIQALAGSFEYIITDTELEALILECNLIKEYQPRYNVLLKDDKLYPYIKLSLGDDFPQVSMVRLVEKDKAKYFGPFSSSTTVQEIVELIHMIWPLKRCTKKVSVLDTPEKREKERACLNYHIGKCSSPCTGAVSKDEYARIVAEVYDFLSGKRENIVKKLEVQMSGFAEALEFEKAAEVRDRIFAVKRLDDRQKLNAISTGDHDVAAFARNGDDALVQVFFIRDGKMTGREHFMLSGVAGDEDGQLMRAFITQFYGGTAMIPKEIDIEGELPDRQVLEEWLGKRSGRKILINMPQRGDKLKLVQLAKSNAELVLTQFGEQIRREKERTEGALAEIAGLLGIESAKPLKRIEAYDISNIHGYESVASMVVFEDGKPKRSDYRKFKIKSVMGANDYASMEEVLTRRLNRYEKEKAENLEAGQKKFSKLPDIIMIDGGKGQVSTAERVLASLSAEGIPVCGMVKDDKHRTRGLVYNGEEFLPHYTTEGFKLIVRIQDEVHRFAVEYHRKLREKAMVRSVLDDIKGIGPARRKALMRHFGSVEGVENASVEELAKVEKMNVRAAETVHGFFHGNGDEAL